MKRTKTPKDVARLFIRGYKAICSDGRWEKELTLLCKDFDDMSMFLSMEAEEGDPSGQIMRDAKWLADLSDALLDSLQTNEVVKSR